MDQNGKSIPKKAYFLDSEKMSLPRQKFHHVVEPEIDSCGKQKPFVEMTLITVVSIYITVVSVLIITVETRYHAGLVLDRGTFAVSSGNCCSFWN